MPHSGKFVATLLPCRMDCPHLGASCIEIRERVKKAQVSFGIEKKLMLVLAGNRDQKGRKLLELLD
jgi:hypothetical protein